MHRARQHHEECDAHGDYDEMQKDKRHNAMKPMVFMKQEANMSRHSTWSWHKHIWMKYAKQLW